MEGLRGCPSTQLTDAHAFMPHARTQTTLAETAPFTDPFHTRDGAPRAVVSFQTLKTLWVNTGTLCNIACANCYIESSPTNDALAYFRLDDLLPLLDEAASMGAQEVGFTGGEPFMNPEMLAMAETALARGFSVLILTNAMRPAMRPKIQAGLRALNAMYGARLSLRVSLDHYTHAAHDAERGAGAFQAAIDGASWFVSEGFSVSIAGRSLVEEPEDAARAGYDALFRQRGWPLNAANPSALVIFPEMKETASTPEISEACWDFVGQSPSAMMCADQRMAVKRKGADAPTIVACTLLPYDERFEMGARLEDAVGDVALNHPHCSRFCVLGGAKCAG